MSDAYVGEIRLFAGNYAPQGWRFCDGSLLQVNQSPALFALISSLYGGDGRTTFALPDLRGRIPVGQGQGAGLSNRPLASFGGTETVPVTSNNMPAHSHGFTTTSAVATTPTPGPTLLLSSFTKTQVVTGLYAKPVNPPPAPPTATVALNPNAVMAAGAPAATRSNLMGALAINYIICLDGYFPDFN
ncbi:tail fiber protein [Pseudomonas sp. SWRI107]|uniref:phage tail protein n=1 Tax=Pseudomonas TaxID=286 RepID=UPI001645BAA0|nr:MULTISPECIES: tail fiber protein [Pseudomonas]MBC3411720.1 tail fiber protein [Pseudomonas sp. SWRI51]MBV4533717.1 tail fiber protein [Pseudomonas farsensis]